MTIKMGCPMIHGMNLQGAITFLAIPVNNTRLRIITLGAVKRKMFHGQTIRVTLEVFWLVAITHTPSTRRRIVSPILISNHIPDQVNRSNPAQYSYPVKPFGYADNNPLGDAPYTLPDNPYSDTIENSGGDAFDISWAVDADGNYVDLPSIDFVKV